MGRENGQGAVDEYNYKKIVQRRFKNNGKTQLDTRVKNNDLLDILETT